MRCVYCDAKAARRTKRSTVALCNKCYGLAERGDWRVLAFRHLVAKPEEWIDDVAAFIEHTFEGTGPVSRIDHQRGHGRGWR